MSQKITPVKIFSLTALAMIAFAANSVLARLALSSENIGPWSFTTIRFISGALILVLIARPKTSYQAGNWMSALALLAYGAFFSYAYLMLSAGTGALILFAAVQFTMIYGGLISGERLSLIQWIGSAIAIFGLIYLLSPSFETPPLIGALLMMISGVGWGLYSLRGRKAGNPAAQTAGNFIRTAIICLISTPLILLVIPEASVKSSGLILALMSGMALKDLTAIRAGIAQLTVPLIAAIGGMLFIAEPMTWRFTLTALAILGGVGVATMTRQKS